MGREEPELPRIAASQSFTEDEVNVLDAVLAILRRGGDPKILARAPAFLGLQRKTTAMKARVEEVKRIRALPPAPPPPQRVGTPVSGMGDDEGAA